MGQKPKVGGIGWVDLTVPNAAEMRDFYQGVVGWTSSEVAMGGYSDFCMHAVAGEPPVAGVCHARGENAELPPAWLVYFMVDDIDQSIASCLKMGGKVLVGPKKSGDAGRFCVIQDPAGAVSALFQPSAL